MHQLDPAKYAVPDEVRNLVGKAMTPTGLDIWWIAEHSLLDNKRPMDLWPTEKQRVIDFINAAKGGDMA